MAKRPSFISTSFPSVPPEVLNSTQRYISGIKDSDAGRGWGQEEKGTTENEIAGWHQVLDGCESE